MADLKDDKKYTIDQILAEAKKNKMMKQGSSNINQGSKGISDDLDAARKIINRQSYRTDDEEPFEKSFGATDNRQSSKKRQKHHADDTTIDEIIQSSKHGSNMQKENHEDIHSATVSSNNSNVDDFIVHSGVNLTEKNDEVPAKTKIILNSDETPLINFMDKPYVEPKQKTKLEWGKDVKKAETKSNVKPDNTDTVQDEVNETHHQHQDSSHVLKTAMKSVSASTAVSSKKKRTASPETMMFNLPDVKGVVKPDINNKKLPVSDEDINSKNDELDNKIELEKAPEDFVVDYTDGDNLFKQSDNSDETDEESVEEKEQSKSKRKFLFKGEEDETPDEEIYKPKEKQDDVINDFTDYDDRESISLEFSIQKRKLFVRLPLILLTTIAAVVMALITKIPYLSTTAISPTVNPIYYVGINMILLIFGMLVCMPTVMGGISSLFMFKMDSDSSPAVVTLVTLAHTIFMFWHLEDIRTDVVSLYGSVALMALLFNTIGKISIISRAKRNFILVSGKCDKFSAEIMDAESTEAKKVRNATISDVLSTGVVKTKFLSNYLTNSYEEDLCDKRCQSLTPMAVIGALVISGVVYFLNRDFTITFSSFTAIMAVSVPMLSVVLGSSLLNKASKKLIRKNTIICGNKALDELSDCNAITLNDTDLFPKGSVVLHGIKTFDGGRIDEAILDAAAVIVEAGGPLQDVFTNVINGEVGILPTVDSLVYEENMGISGWVSGKRVLIGNSNLLVYHEIDVPSKDYEERYKKDDRQLVYLSVAGSLTAMFVVSYLPNEDMAYELARLDKHGFSLLVRSYDPNLNADFIANAYGLDPTFIKVLTSIDSKKEKDKFKVTKESSDCKIASTDSVTHLLGGINTCLKLKSNIVLASVLQAMAVIIGYAAVAFLSFHTTSTIIGVTQILAYHTAWIILMYLFTRVKIK